MPDGKRKRRLSENSSKRLWYAKYRSARFCRRFSADQPAVNTMQIAQTIARETIND